MIMPRERNLVRQADRRIKVILHFYSDMVHQLTNRKGIVQVHPDKALRPENRRIIL